MRLLTEPRALSAQGEKRALVSNLTVPALGLPGVHDRDRIVEAPTRKMSITEFQRKQSPEGSEFREEWGHYHSKPHAAVATAGTVPVAAGDADSPLGIDERPATQHPGDEIIAFGVFLGLARLVGVTLRVHCQALPAKSRTPSELAPRG